MHMKLLCCLIPVLLLFCSACTARPSQPAETQTLTILAAVSLNEAFTELADVFRTGHPGVEMSFNFSGSQQLAQQLTNGAPADVFASANQRQMDVVVEEGRIRSGDVAVFAQNRLVIISPNENPGEIEELKDLARPGLKLILAAQEVPVGQYSLNFLEKAAADPSYGESFRAAVLENVVSYEDNVRAVLTKVSLGEADAGIVYTSDVTGRAAGHVTRLDIPDAFNISAAYPIAVVEDSANAALAQEFVSLVLSPQGQQVLAKYGFIPVNETQ